MYADPNLMCPVCHDEDFEIVRSEKLGFVVLCNECGYARGATLEHLVAS